MAQRNKMKIPGFSKRRLIRGAVYVVIGLAAWVAQQQGWINPTDNSNSQTSASNKEVVKSDPVTVSASDKTKNDNSFIAQLYKQKRSDEIVTAVGKVGKVLPDDNKGSRHQKFLLDIGQAKWLLVAHNIDLAQKVPLKKGDAVVVHGEYEWNEKGGVIHWTHHDPRGYHEDGYIEHNGKRYK